MPRQRRASADLPAKAIADLRTRYAAAKASGRDVLGGIIRLFRQRLRFDDPWVHELDELVAELARHEEPDRAHVQAVLGSASSAWPRQSCPCGSRECITDCCYSAPDATAASSVMRPSSTRNGRSLEGCYAGELADCRPPLTREHIVSENVLRRIAGSDGMLVASGIAGVPHTAEARRSTKAIAASVLCERHNAALSGLDAVGGELMDAMKAIAIGADLGPSAVGSLRFSFYGPDVERWMLKVLVRNIASGEAHYAGMRLEATRPPIDLLRILFGHAQLPIMSGLFIVPSSNFDRAGVPGLAMRPLVWGRGMAGLANIEWGVPLVLAVVPPGAGPDSHVIANGYYRPKQIWGTRGGADVRIDLHWDPRWNGPVAVITRDSSSALR